MNETEVWFVIFYAPETRTWNAEAVRLRAPGDPAGVGFLVVREWGYTPLEALGSVLRAFRWAR